MKRNQMVNKIKVKVVLRTLGVFQALRELFYSTQTPLVLVQANNNDLAVYSFGLKELKLVDSMEDMAGEG